MSANLLVDGPGIWAYHFAIKDEDREIRVGRGPDCQFKITGLEVEANHALLISTPGGWMIRDLGGPCGTFVNGQRIAEHTLRDGDTIQFGKTYAVFQDAKKQLGQRPAEETWSFLTAQERRIRDAIEKSTGAHPVALPSLWDESPGKAAQRLPPPAPAAPPKPPISEQALASLPPDLAAGILTNEDSLWVAEQLADLLAEIARARNPDVRQTYTLVLAKLKQILGADNGFLMIPDDVRKKWVIRAWVGDAKKWTDFGKKQPIPLTIANRAWTEERAVSDAPGSGEAGPGSRSMDALQVRSYIAVPVFYKGAKSGLLYYDMRRLGATFILRDVRLLERIGEYMMDIEKR